MTSHVVLRWISRRTICSFTFFFYSVQLSSLYIIFMQTFFWFCLISRTRTPCPLLALNLGDPTAWCTGGVVGSRSSLPGRTTKARSTPAAKRGRPRTTIKLQSARGISKKRTATAAARSAALRVRPATSQPRARSQSASSRARSRSTRGPRGRPAKKITRKSRKNDVYNVGVDDGLKGFIRSLFLGKVAIIVEIGYVFKLTYENIIN